MNILETFLILFKSDASDVKKGADEAEKSTKKLDKSLKSVGKESESVGKNFLSFAQNAANAFSAIASFGAIFSSILAATNPIKQIGDVARELDVGVESLDAWSNAVQKTGGTAAEFQNSLRNLAQNFNTTNEAALQSLPDLADALSKMNNIQARYYGKSLGLDQATIYLLQRGRKEIESTIKRQKEFGIITADDVRKTRAFDDGLFDLGLTLRNLRRDLVLPALPLLTDTLKYLTDNKDLIKGALIAISVGVSAIGVASIAASPAIRTITLALIAFTAAYDDVAKFMSGGKSLLGDIAKFSQMSTDDIGQKALSLINNFHLPKFLGGKGNQSNSVSVGDVTINTQATNGQEVVQEFNKYLQDLKQANAQNDSGVKI